MKYFDKKAAQGDVYFTRVEVLPAGLKKVTPENGQFVVAHSETGHHHVIDATPAVEFFQTDDPLTAYLRVIEATEETEVALRHLRSWDTHESIAFKPGVYKVRYESEHTPEGWRKAAD
jgi:hypothetical protein